MMIMMMLMMLRRMRTRVIMRKMKWRMIRWRTMMLWRITRRSMMNRYEQEDNECWCCGRSGGVDDVKDHEVKEEGDVEICWDMLRMMLRGPIPPGPTRCACAWSKCTWTTFHKHRLSLLEPLSLAKPHPAPKETRSWPETNPAWS